MSDEFRQKAIKIIIDYGSGNEAELNGLDDAALLQKYCEITGESAEDYKDAYRNEVIIKTRIASCFALSQSYETFGYRVTYVPLLSSYFGGSQIKDNIHASM